MASQLSQIVLKVSYSNSESAVIPYPPFLAVTHVYKKIKNIWSHFRGWTNPQDCNNYIKGLLAGIFFFKFVPQGWNLLSLLVWPNKHALTTVRAHRQTQTADWDQIMTTYWYCHKFGLWGRGVFKRLLDSVLSGYSTNSSIFVQIRNSSFSWISPSSYSS